MRASDREGGSAALFWTACWLRHQYAWLGGSCGCSDELIRSRMLEVPWVQMPQSGAEGWI